ncbi:plexin domain-containing protein 1 isoform X2 [Esox lucius]|uniref:plexin domain-containing protein 1 isoform X2 n=1 Tax=Esox lucius TaxID=8010 RepID=UPI0005768320|nr:plexin domain-containing protein 1 isoform X2 [Esox lucius]
MGLYAVLLICLSQAELGRLWAKEQTDDMSIGIDGGSSRISRTYQNQEPSNKYGLNRAVRSALGGGLDIDTLPDNITKVVEDSQRYYRWRSYGPGDIRMQELWVDLSTMQLSPVKVHGILSNTHRQAARVALSFDFPFYGHYLRQITIATGGFIFTGEITHRMLTATQYIAPLMANFDPSFSKNSTVRYMDNGKVFVVQWDKVHLQGREAEGIFTFQAALHRNGTIAFNYRDVPLPIEKINSTEHPVKVGLSDAFMALLPSPQSKDGRRTIYEYHRVEIDTIKIINHSAFEFTPLPTCLQHTSCELCLMSNLTKGCGWCNTLQRCSDGIDRHRQEWLDYNCPEEAKESICESYTQGLPEGSVDPFNRSATEPTPSSAVLADIPVTEDLQTGPPNQDRTKQTAIIAGVVAALILLVALTLLAVYYINTHPTVAPPFYLMQRQTNSYWPSMKFRNQSCHSTYAEVELTGHDKEGFIEAEQCC